MPVSPSSRCLSSSAELRRTIRLIAVSTLIIVLITPTAQSQQQQQQQTDQQQRESEQPATNASLGRLLQEHCLVCHGDGGVTEGDIDLRALHRYSKQHAALPDDARLPLHPELPITVMQKVTRVLDLREMPPEDMEQPTKDLRQTAISELKHWLRQAAERQPAMTAPIRRMNRFQYHNAVQDLFRLKCIVFTMPERMMREHQSYFQPASGVMPDRVMVGSRPLGKSQMIEPRLAGVAPFPQDLRAEHGFDNQADHLSLSPLLMEAFLKLGQSITQSKDFTPRTVGIWNEFFASPKDGDEQRAIRLRLAPFLRRAFRQPIDEDTLNRYVTFVRQQRQGGASFTDAMKTVAAAAISSPRFLYLYASQTSDPDAGPDSFTVASRLSFFLWGSIPDDRLLNLAAEGRLLEEAVLVDELQRMLQDRKLKRFCDSFPSQWLQLERIISSVPNRQKFPQFYFSKYRDSMHMMLEPLLLFETVLIENQSAIQLIDPDFSYRSVLLDEAYGKLKVNLKAQQKKGGGAVTQLPFYRIPIEDRRTGGVITNAAVMTMTSGPERTQPITRGAWLATVIFNNPPEPPPADVPPLGEKPAAGEEHLTLRERLAAHRERSDCRGCHERIDPLGFALENFDPVGEWREQYENDREIDMSGTLFRQHAFSSVVEFKDAILQEKHRFAEALSGHLLRYALGRELTAADEFAVADIAAAARDENYRMHSLLRAVVLSPPFLSGQQATDAAVATSQPSP